jgi:hypothetical protein
MLIGHFAAALIGKSIKREIPLWHLMLAANAMDFFWVALNFLKIESFSITDPNTPGSSAFFWLNLHTMPWSHGLLASLALSVLLGWLYLNFFNQKRYDIAGVFAVIVWSHWWLDLVVHRPDLHIVGDNYQGWGLWSSVTASLIIELGFFVIAIAAYVLRTEKLPQSLFGDKSFAEMYKLDSVWLFAGVLIMVQILFSFIPPFKPEWFFLVCFAMLILLIPMLSWLVDAKRGACYRGATYLAQDR